MIRSRNAAPFPLDSSRGAVAQLGERLNGIQEVVGSIPIGSTKQINYLLSPSALINIVGASSGATCGLNPHSLLTASRV